MPPATNTTTTPVSPDKASAVRRCACGCGQIVGPLEQWASHACYRADEGHERQDDRG